ncbi:MAG: acetate--CoA ligase family protein [Thermodesulfobacteriota bacterium]
MLDALFTPRTIAVIGASRTPGKVGHDILANLQAGGFAGSLIPVNPDADAICGLPCRPNLQGLAERIDLGIVALPAAAAPEAVRQLVRAGARAVVVVSAGFKETGPEGAGQERELARLCREGGARLLGPNCLGLINTSHHLNASFAGPLPPAGPISILSQSGAVCTALLDLARGRGLGLAKVVSLGNKADLSEVDLLLALARDPDTRVILGYLEDIVSGEEFVKAAEEAATRKPVVILKAGTTEAGRLAASSHTGVLAGAEVAYGAAFLRAGVIRADSFAALFDYGTALALQPLPAPGRRVLIITNAGGPGIIAADAVERAGLFPARLDGNTTTALRQRLPPAASLGNPVDVLGDADPSRYAAAIAAAQDDPGVDAILVILTPQAMTQPAATATAIAGVMRGEKPVVAAFMGGDRVMPGRRELAASHIPDFDTPEQAVATLTGLFQYAAWRARPPRLVTRFRVNRRRVERIIFRRLRTGRLRIGEVKAKDILKAYGFRIPNGCLASSGEEAVEIAERLGYPVVMKIVSPDIVHKSDFGGVRLNVATSEAVLDNFDLMMLRIRERAPEARVDGVYLEEMLGRGLEVIIGMTRDRQFGPMLMFGLGGIFVEVMKDVTFHLAPITLDEAMQMLMATRSYEILQGARGQRGVNLAAIADGLQRISQLATDFPAIAELDINPFIVSAGGSEPFVADARITLSPAEARP